MWWCGFVTLLLFAQWFVPVTPPNMFGFTRGFPLPCPVVINSPIHTCYIIHLVSIFPSPSPNFQRVPCQSLLSLPPCLNSPWEFPFSLMFCWSTCPFPLPLPSRSAVRLWVPPHSPPRCIPGWLEICNLPPFLPRLKDHANDGISVWVVLLPWGSQFFGNSSTATRTPETAGAATPGAGARGVGASRVSLALASNTHL